MIKYMIVFTVDFQLLVNRLIMMDEYEQQSSFHYHKNVIFSFIL